MCPIPDSVMSNDGHLTWRRTHKRRHRHTYIALSAEAAGPLRQMSLLVYESLRLVSSSSHSALPEEIEFRSCGSTDAYAAYLA